MNSIKEWFDRNQTLITLFIIGWMTVGGIESLVVGNYIWAVIYFLCVCLNFMNLREKF
jgi:hypothetical protein